MTSALRPLLLVALFVTSGCGYALAGRGSSLPAYIQVIGVPLFKNATAIFDIDRILTERVRTELIGRGSFRVVPEGIGVDALVDATITSVNIQPVTYDENAQASRYYITITARVAFRDLKTNKEIWSNPSMSFRDEYQIDNATTAGDPAMFFGQETNAVTRLASDFAKSVVSAMLEGF